MDLGKLYDNRAAVPEYPAIVAGWLRDADLFRSRARGECDVAYGARPRNRLDLFHPRTDRGGPLILFIHGGYWRSFDKSSFSHMARGALAHGFSVAVPSYSLCPEVGVLDIIDELRQCCLFLRERCGRPLIVAGHSAGGHLAACMAATDWPAHRQPRGLVQAVFAVSGLFDLRPLLATPLNGDLRLSPAEAAAASPLLWPVPQSFAVEAWVGAAETTEFLRQSASLVAAWKGIGLDANYAEVPGTNHFTIVSELAGPETAMTQRLVALALSVTADVI